MIVVFSECAQKVGYSGQISIILVADMFFGRPISVWQLYETQQLPSTEIEVSSEAMQIISQASYYVRTGNF